MRGTELDNCRAMLESKQVELDRRLKRLDEIAVERAPDTMDDLQLANERELAIMNLERDTNLLTEVRAALERIADGSYGSCLNCQEPIRPARLAAVPWASYCVKCQDSIDRVRKANRGPGQWLGEAA